MRRVCVTRDPVAVGVAAGVTVGLWGRKIFFAKSRYPVEGSEACLQIPLNRDRISVYSIVQEVLDRDLCCGGFGHAF